MGGAYIMGGGLLYFVLLLKIIFSHSASKTDVSRNKLLNRLKTKNPTGAGTSNRFGSTTYKSIL